MKHYLRTFYINNNSNSRIFSLYKPNSSALSRNIMFRNLYDIFDLPDFYDDDYEIRRLYRLLGSRWHPRRNIHMHNYAEKRFKDLSRAFAILANKESKKRYDNLLKEAPTEKEFSDVLAPFNEDKGLDHYHNFFTDFLKHDDILFNDDFFKKTDKEFKELGDNHIYKSVKSNISIKDGKRITKTNKTFKDKDGNQVNEYIEEDSEGKKTVKTEKIYHDKDGNLLKEITEDKGQGPQVIEQKMLALKDKKEDDITIEDESEKKN